MVTSPFKTRFFKGIQKKFREPKRKKNERKKKETKDCQASSQTHFSRDLPFLFPSLNTREFRKRRAVENMVMH